MDESSERGPKVNRKELDHMQELVDTSVTEGATVACGGKVAEVPGFKRGNWFEPTVLTDVTQEMTTVREDFTEKPLSKTTSRGKCPCRLQSDFLSIR